jgi:succinate-semialdehyde dehydrogenase/glutarate-semialdehyde dehydrogenase
MIARKIAPAIAAGCCAIIKPSELTPFSALAIALLAKESGIPDGVVNVITGNADKISDILCSDKRVKKISFTGSSRVGKILYKKSADTLKKLSLELGGNAPVIICEDANIEKTAKNLLKAKLRSTGQACTSPNRIFVHESIYDIIINNLVDRFSNLKIGNGFNQEVNIAPLINKVAVEKIARLLKDATSKGAKILTGGKLAEYYFDQNNNKSKTKIDHNFFEPTIIINCTKNMDIFREEIFGPVLAFYKFNNIDDVIEMANDTDYGLSAYIYTESTELSWKLSSRLDYGMVGINDALISNEIGAFGGRKESGFGVEGSKLGIYEYLNTKYKLVSY